jgi:hypothetical protein
MGGSGSRQKLAQANTYVFPTQARPEKPAHKLPSSSAHGQFETDYQLFPRKQVQEFEIQIRTWERLLAQRSVILDFVQRIQRGRFQGIAVYRHSLVFFYKPHHRKKITRLRRQIPQSRGRTPKLDTFPTVIGFDLNTSAKESPVHFVAKPKLVPSTFPAFCSNADDDPSPHPTMAER